MSGPATALAHALDLPGADAWVWIAPHPSDPSPRPSQALVTRLGARVGDRLVPSVEIRSRRGKAARTFQHELVTPDGRPVGSIDFEFNINGNLRAGTITDDAGTTVRWSPGGLLQLPDAFDLTPLMTRGAPVSDRAPLTIDDAIQSAKDVAGKLAGRLRARRRRDDDGGSPEVEAPPPATASSDPTGADAPPDLPDWRVPDPARVDGEFTAFDGWLRAHQHDAVDGPPPGESWRVVVDHDREPPGPLALTLVAVAAATAHRRLLNRSGDGLAALLLG